MRFMKWAIVECVSGTATYDAGVTGFSSAGFR
jgi:hypothetical protein